MQESVDDCKRVDPELKRWRLYVYQHYDENGRVQSSKYLIRGLVTYYQRCEEEPPFALANRIKLVDEEKRDHTQEQNF